MPMDDALITLAHIIDPEDPGVAALVDELGAQAVVDRIASGRLPLRTCAVLRERLQRLDLDAARAQAERIGARILVRDAPEWPTQLDDLGPTRPYALWVLGAANLRLALIRSVSVVGARASTPYGEQVARQWCSTFAERDVAVVSGGALGIDAAAHRAVLACEGLTVCVLAGGVDVPYPRAHEALIARIADEGLVVSESPLGESPRRQRFVTRNRLIAAMTGATVIVESALRSGTSITARRARDLERHLFAVPGPITSPASAGCHDLIAAGEAMLADDPATVLRALPGIPVAPDAEPLRLPLDDLTEVQSRVLDAAPSRGSIGAEEFAVRSGVPVPQAMAALGQLAAIGMLRRTDSGWGLTPRA